MYRRWFRLPYGLSGLYVGDASGQLVADVLVEKVAQEWRDGVVFSESREVVKTGRRALALPASR
jgi:hypothetical protein